jgi:hypothetical protein
MWICMMSVAVSLISSQGCSSTGLIFRDPAKLARDPGLLIGKPKVEKSVARIVTLWEASSGKDPSDKPARGFAGQILFFGPHGETGARVHGKVVIYEYDNYSADLVDDPVPLHSFTFEPDAWEVHRTEGTLGHSYSCFIPYMNKQRGQANCGLKVEFIGDDGRTVSSEIVEVLLPSRSAAASAAGRTRGFVREAQIGATPQVERAAHSDAKPAKQDKLDSMSIPLPRK